MTPSEAVPGRVLNCRVHKFDALRSSVTGSAPDVRITMTSGDRKFETGFYQVGAGARGVR